MGRRLDRQKKRHLRSANLFVIGVEGEKRERQYFEMFQSMSNVRIVIAQVQKSGESSPPHVLRRTLDEIENDPTWDPAHDQSWVVVDDDHQHRNHHGECNEECKRRGIKYVINKPCFELWILCHFLGADEVAPLINRNCKSLKTEVGKACTGRKVVELWKHLESSVGTALKNSETIPELADIRELVAALEKRMLAKDRDRFGCPHHQA